MKKAIPVMVIVALLAATCVVFADGPATIKMTLNPQTGVLHIQVNVPKDGCWVGCSYKKDSGPEQDLGVQQANAGWSADLTFALPDGARDAIVVLWDGKNEDPNHKCEWKDRNGYCFHGKNRLASDGWRRVR